MTVVSPRPTAAAGRPAKRRRGSGPLDRLLHALNDPIRRRILRNLAQRPGSASSLAREFRMNLGVVSYHLNQVLARECEVVEIVETVPRRGAIEKFYRLKPDGLTGVFSVEAEGPVRTLSLEECFLAAVEAIDARSGGFREGAAWDWLLVELDSEGWREVRAAQAEFDRRLVSAAEGSRSRASGRGVQAAVVGAVAIPASDLFPPTDDD